MILPQGTATLSLRSSGLQRIVGVDEAGCGALAGPVVAGAVMLPPDHGLAVRDSKTLSERQRERLYDEIHAVALEVAVGIVDAHEIDEMGIRPATLLAMRKAAEGVGPCDHFLVDARTIPEIKTPQTAIIRGDQKEFCIAAASIIAKVTRDRLMIAADAIHPVYAFAQHKGYGTKAHRLAVLEHGPSVLHRKSFTVRA